MVRLTLVVLDMHIETVCLFGKEQHFVVSVEQLEGSIIAGCVPLCRNENILVLVVSLHSCDQFQSFFPIGVVSGREAAERSGRMKERIEQCTAHREEIL